MLYIDGIETRRRYARSINLERDLADASALDGYVVTPRARETLQLFCERYRARGAVRAFTVTAVYGAGKSAFMHFLLSLLAPRKDRVREKALSLLQSAIGKGELYRFYETLPQKQPAFLRAVAVSRAESIAVTLSRALLAALNDSLSPTEKEFRTKVFSYLLRDNAEMRAALLRLARSSLFFSEAATYAETVIHDLGAVAQHDDRVAVALAGRRKTWSEFKTGFTRSDGRYGRLEQSSGLEDAARLLSLQPKAMLKQRSPGTLRVLKPAARSALLSWITWSANTEKKIPILPYLRS
jgi:hypothetical protein